MSENNITGLKALLHGADYNPEQWLNMPEILERDIELMKKAGINCVSVGIFSWTSLEPEEGVYTFGWLESVINRRYDNGIYIVLATPTGAKLSWMAKKYPEYQFEKHKGYGTKLHYEMIDKYGICEIHRKTFLKKVLNK